MQFILYFAILYLLLFLIKHYFGDIFRNIYNKMDLEWLWLIIPVAYIIISTFFLCFPNILHQRKQYQYQPFNELVQSKKLFCIGHRGGAFEGPENTMQVFKSTAKISHLFQLDICLTKDAQLVVHHDTNLRRTCGVDKQIGQLNYSQLPTFSKEYAPFGRDQPMKTDQNRIILLQDLFKEFPDMPLNIDLKTPTDEAIKQFDRLVRKYRRESITIWGSMNGEKNTRLRELNPQVTNFYSPMEMLKVTFLCMFGLLPFVCLREGAVQIPLLTAQIKNMASKINICVRCIILTVLHLFNFLSRFFIPHLRKRGILTFYWILNEEQDFSTAISMGCAGIMSDYPTKLARFLKNQQLYFQNSSDSL